MAPKKPKPPDYVTVYHATTADRVAAILKGGFKPSERGAGGGMKDPVWVTTIPPDSPVTDKDGMVIGHAAVDLVPELFGQKDSQGNYPEVAYLQIDNVPRRALHPDPDAPTSWKFAKVVSAEKLNAAAKPVVYQQPEPHKQEPPPKDPLLDLLDGKTADKPDKVVEDILDLIGGNTFDKPKPKPVEPQEKRPTYLEHLLGTKDSTDKAHVVMPTDLVNLYREYDRQPGGKDTRPEYADVREAIRQHGGIRQPLWISTDGKTAMLVEGNNRLAVAKELGIQELPVRVTFDKETMRNEGADPVPLDPALKKWVEKHHIEGRFGSDAFPDSAQTGQRIGFKEPHKQKSPPGPMGININDEVDDFTGSILKGWKTVETRDTPSLNPYVGQRVGIIQTGVGPARLVGYVTVGEPIKYTSREQFGEATPQHRIYAGTTYDFKDELGVKYGYPMLDPEIIAPKLVTSKGNVARSIAPEHLQDFPKLDLPDVEVDIKNLRLIKDIKESIKEFEGYGLTNDNSKVRRVLNSAERGDRLMLVRDKSGKPVAAALVSYIGEKSKHPDHIIHELFKDEDAPRHAGSLLMVEAARQAKAANAELSVRGALNTARTYYRDMGGDLSVFVQPGGRRETNSNTPRWDTLHRDALADARPIPTAHWVEPKGRDADGNIIWRDPTPWKPYHVAPQPHALMPPPDREPGYFTGSRKSRSYANPANREDIKARGAAIDPAYRAAVKDINHRVTEFVRAAYVSNPTFLANHEEIDRIAALVAPAVVAGQMQIAELTNAQLSKLFGLEHVPPADAKKYARPGVSREQELARPFWTAVKAAREGKPVDEALAIGMHRMEKMLDTDFQMAKVIQSREVLKASDIQTYARVAGPKACWLCAIAATQTYYTRDLLPIHPGCGCDVVPVPPGGQHSLDTLMDPEYVLKHSDEQINLMEPLVESGEPASEYRKLIAVREHGEIGPQLTWAHQKFTGPADLPTPPSKEVLAQQAYDAVRANGGITIDLAGHQPTDGYAYAPYKTTEFKVPEAEFTPKHIDDYIDRHAKQLARKGNNLGMWTQDGYVYLDVSKVGAPTVDTFAKAQAAHQLAVFDLGNFNEINLGTIDPITKEYRNLGTPADLHRQYREQVARRDESVGARGVPEVSGRPQRPRGSTSAATGLELWPSDLKVAAPTKRQAVNDMINEHWAGLSFDDFKDDIRSGVRSVETQGYLGLKHESKYIDLAEELKRYEKFGNNAGPDGPSPEMLFVEGQELAARAVHSTPTDTKRFRGIGMTTADLKGLVAGDELSLPASSFTHHPALAAKFGEGDRNWWQSRDYPKNAKPVVIQLEPGAKIAHIEHLMDSGGEDVAFGTFEIVRVDKTAHLGAIRRAGDVPELVPGPESATGRKSFTVVTVRQKSLIETPAGKPQDLKGDNKIPEYTIIKKGPLPQTLPGKNVEADDKGRLFVDVGHHTAKTYKPKLDFVPDTTELLHGVPMLLPDNVIDPRAIPDIKHAVNDMMTKYPFARLEYVGPPMIGRSGRELDKGIGNAYAMTMPTHPIRRNADELKYASRISLNPKWFNPGAPFDENLRSHDKDGVAVGFFHSHGDKGPIYQTVVHEFGHVMVNEGGDSAVKQVNKTLTDMFKKERPDLYAATRKGTVEEKMAAKEAVREGYEKWLRDNLSGYSLTSSGKVNPDEALAEAFADVEILGDKASKPAKALHDMLVREALPKPGTGPDTAWWDKGVTQADVDKYKKLAGLKLEKPSKVVADKEAKRVAAQQDKEAKAAARAEAKAAKEAAAAAKAAAKAEKARLEEQVRGKPPGETRKLLPNGKPLPPRAERVAELQKRIPEFIANQESRYAELTYEEKVNGRRWYADQCTAAANQALDGGKGFLPIQGVAVNVALSPQTRYDWNTAQGQWYLSHDRGTGYEAIRNMPKGVAPKAMDSNAKRADRVSAATTYEEVMAALQEKSDSKKLSNYFRSAWVKGFPDEVPNAGDIFTVDTWAVRTMDHSQDDIRRVLSLPPGTRLTERQESRGEQLLNAEKYGTHWEWDKVKKKWMPVPNYRSVDMISDDYDVFQKAGVEAARKAPLFAGTYESRFNKKTGRFETVKTSDEPTPWRPEDYQAALWGQIVPAAPPGEK